MTKADLIEEVSRVVEMTRKESEVIVEAIFDSIVRSLRGGAAARGREKSRTSRCRRRTCAGRRAVHGRQRRHADAGPRHDVRRADDRAAG